MSFFCNDKYLIILFLVGVIGCGIWLDLDFFLDLKFFDKFNDFKIKITEFHKNSDGCQNQISRLL